MSSQTSHNEVNNFLRLATESIAKGFTAAAQVAHEMHSYRESSIAAKRVFTLNPTSEKMLQLFPNFAPLVQAIYSIIEQIMIQISKTDADPNLWMTLGHGYLVIGDFPNAFSAYARAIRLNPNNNDIFFLYAYGIVYNHYNYKDHAQSCFTQVLAEKEKFIYYPDLVFRFAILLRSKGEYDKALEFFDISLHNPPNGLSDADIQFQRAYTLSLKRDNNSAFQIYQTLYQHYPNSIEAVEQYVWFLYLNKNNTMPNDEIQKIINEHRDHPNLTILSARIAMKENDTEKAYQSYRSCIPYWSENSYFWCALGCLYYRNGQEKDAEIAFSRSIYLDPNFEEAWLNLGLVLDSRPQMALEIYKQGKDRCVNSRELEKRIQSYSLPSHPTPTIIEVNDANFFEQVPLKFASQYVNAVPILPASLFGKATEGLNFEEFSTFPKSLFA
ncbi:TPR Domain containing protein [Trichomonas vaginalis G3]|uniref:TPR Domain containing protein n=1 Tax=Trichomonas vaginalis (strain ATCC PRA-98 / G3) TaxID=412133 RepID=A2FAW8_TRIV3|nr:cellular component assembly [Trichomonas vaginalis G3]EAX97945.1 TPR Domain containing protein [Trichomonas vaginalis G3]KAI5502541.1 cellular component assembly [Trichomonas vaginalis G3]|eukprot:XP_001310875.1 TPR Domain containing protein [Trichomonas vaginalis G3]